MDRQIRRLAIVNRGEPAVRALTAVAELNQAGGQPPIRTVVLYTDPDADAWYVREADEAVSLGTATFVDPVDGTRRSRYLDEAAVIAALRGAAGCPGESNDRPGNGVFVPALTNSAMVVAMSRVLTASAAAQGGRHANGRTTYGHSIAISPWGDILAEAGTEPCVIVADIDPAEVDMVRTRMVASSAITTNCIPISAAPAGPTIT